MAFSNWLDRNATRLMVTVSAAIIAGLFATVSLLISELGQENRASIAQIRDDARQMRVEMRANTLQFTEEMRNIRVVVDRLETKVDELVGLFKYHPALLRDGSPPESDEPYFCRDLRTYSNRDKS